MIRRDVLKLVFGSGALLGLAAACGPAPAQPAGSTAAPAAAPPATQAPTTAAAPAVTTPAPTPQAPAAPAATSAVPAAPAAAASQGRQVVALFSSDPDSMFFNVSRSALSGNIYAYIANGLTKLTQPDMDVDKDLADSWTVSPDGKVYTFTLRQGVKWHDGQPFSAQDVKFSFEYWANPAWPGPLSPAYAIIDGATAYKQGQASEITGLKINPDSTVEFTLTEPSAQFLATTTTSKLIPQHVLKDVSPGDAAKSNFARSPIYTGPFMVSDWKSAESVTFKAYADHFAGKPTLDTILARVIPDPASALDELRSGGIDLMDNISPDVFDSFTSDPNFKTSQLSGAAGWFLSFDLTNPLFSDAHVRQAMSHAIDRQSVVAAIYSGRAEPSYGIASPLSWTYNPNITKFDFDAAMAGKLLDDAGWSTGSDGVRAKDGQRLEFEVLTYPQTQQMALAIQPFLKNVGVNITITQLEFATWLSRQVVGQYQAAVTGWFNFIVDPRADLANHFLSPRPTDATGYQNDQVDQLFMQARTATNRDDEKKLYDQIQQIVSDDAVHVYLWRPQDLLAVNHSVTLPDAKTMNEVWFKAPAWQKS
jgi:peptide/nickel transport system substrate-binding protein